jgi:hypothetical protein
MELARNAGPARQRAEALDRATRALVAASGEPGAEELRAQIAVLRAPRASGTSTARAAGTTAGTAAGSTTVPASAATTQPAYDPKQDFLRAQEDWREGRYDHAEVRLRRVLRREPRNAEAQHLLDLVRKAQSVDPGVRR